MNNKTENVSSKTQVASHSNKMKDILDGRTERLSIPKLQLESRTELTVKPPNKYKTRNQIGEGGMKQIIQVKDRDTARDLAMALLAENPDNEPTVEGRFIHEARITANLEHPNIVPIHDIGVDHNGKPYFTMKLIEGETLAHLLTKVGQREPEYVEKYNLRHLLSIFLKVCDAIDFAHAKGIIHLDLKPENIQIGNYGEVLVLDWGLAKIISDVSDPESLQPVTDKSLAELSKNSNYDKTLDGEIKGTPGFMAPEQAAGHNSKRSQATDIYALGTMLYTILTLCKPIKVKNVQQALDDTVAGNIIPVTERNPARSVPKPLAAVTMKAMALDPADRYQSVKELIDDVDAFLGGYVTEAEDASFIRYCELWIRRNKITSAIGALLILAVIAVCGMLLMYNIKRSSTWGKGVNITPASVDAFNEEWSAVSGNWRYQDGKLYADAGEGDSFVLFYDKLIYGNIAVEFDAEIVDAEDLQNSGDLSVIIAGSKSNPESAGYYLQVGGIGNTSAVIQRRGGFITAVGFSLESGRKYHIRAEKEGAELRLYCDGQKLLAYRDIFYLEGGLIGLYTFGKGKVFSNIQLYKKDVPELVAPTIEGDAFYRESRAATDKSERFKFLDLALKAYSKVYNSYPNSKLGAEALLKRAYINSELGRKNNIISAIHDTLVLKELNPSLDLLLLEGRLYLDGNDFAKAFATYERAVEKYPGSALAVTSLLSGQLTPERSKIICPELRQRFWRLCAENNASPVFRCSNRNLTSLDFLKGLDFQLVDCSKNNIESLDALKYMNLKHLDCADNQITSLEPLKALKLQTLECHNNKNLKDISVLAGMPLTALSLSGCSALTDISPILKCTQLERLTLPEHLVDSHLLNNLPNLKSFNDKWDDWKMTKEEFLKK
jgi:serine/threonine protein kinase